MSSDDAATAAPPSLVGPACSHGTLDGKDRAYIRMALTEYAAIMRAEGLDDDATAALATLAKFPRSGTSGEV